MVRRKYLYFVWQAQIRQSRFWRTLKLSRVLLVVMLVESSTRLQVLSSTIKIDEHFGSVRLSRDPDLKRFVPSSQCRIWPRIRNTHKAGFLGMWHTLGWVTVRCDFGKFNLGSTSESPQIRLHIGQPELSREKSTFSASSSPPHHHPKIFYSTSFEFLLSFSGADCATKRTKLRHYMGLPIRHHATRTSSYHMLVCENLMCSTCHAQTFQHLFH